MFVFNCQEHVAIDPKPNGLPFACLMYTFIQPLQLDIVLEQNTLEMSSTGTFSTNEIRSWKEPKAQNSKTVTFPIPYIAPPGLPLGLNLLDIRSDANLRIAVHARNTTTNGFEAHVNSWADTTLYLGGFSWLEISPDQWEYQYGQFSTTEDHPCDIPQQKTCRRINFMRPFIKPPKVVVFLSQLDMGKDRNWRVITMATDIDEAGFTIHVDTWADSVLYSATAGWVAYPDGKEFVYSGRASIGGVRPWDMPQHRNSKRIDFEDIGFLEKPNVFVAINSLDFGCGVNLRLNTYVDSITATGMTWHINSWSNSVLYNAGISYICIPPASR